VAEARDRVELAELARVDLVQVDLAERVDLGDRADRGQHQEQRRADPAQRRERGKEDRADRQLRRQDQGAHSLFKATAVSCGGA
jgi:hypothetical protein